MTSRGTLPFHIRSVDADAKSGNVSLRYGFGEDAGEDAQFPNEEFVERIVLPASEVTVTAVRADNFARATRILLLVAGTSYFKSQAPDKIVVEIPTTSAEQRLVRELYDHGMREFAYVNQLPMPLVATFEFRGELDQQKQEHETDDLHVGRPLVPFGGGKDSTVVLGLLPEARPVTINGTSTHRSVAKVLGHELIEIRRTVDRLDELTRPDRLNGHIPITAIVSAISVVLAARDGFTSVVLANEAAASEPTLVSKQPGSAGRAVNHQWSKGATFEALFDDAVRSSGIDVRYFSWLREVAENDIVALLSTQTEALHVMVSCNRAFAGRTAGMLAEASQAWCGECPKCVFTFLMLATKVRPDELASIFGQDLLSNAARSDDFAQLWADVKPLECVGERIDAATALVQLGDDSSWRDHLLVQDLRASALAAIEQGEWNGLASDDLDLTPRTAPVAFQHRLTQALGR